MEDFKLIVDLLNNVASGASDLTKLWLILHYGTKMLISVVTAVSLSAAAYVLVKALLGNASASVMLKQYADRMGVRNFDTWHGPDRERFAEAFEKILRDGSKGTSPDTTGTAQR